MGKSGTYFELDPKLVAKIFNLMAVMQSEGSIVYFLGKLLLRLK